jgi:hypothetical protein
VRKLFEDGNYYEGQVISGPSSAFDEEKGKMSLCWRVKYLDDDEEEFTVEELDLWGMDENNQIHGDGVSGILSPDANVTKSEGIVDGEHQRSKEMVSPRKTSIIDIDRSSSASKDNTSTNTPSTDIIASSGNDCTGNVPFIQFSTGIASTGNTSIGKKVKDLQFARTNSAESKLANVDSDDGEKTKAKNEQNSSDYWDSSPLYIKQRSSSAKSLQQLPVLPRSAALKSSPSMRRRRNLRRLSFPTAAVAAAVDDGDKPTENVSVVKDEHSSSTNEVSGSRRRSTRNRSSEEAMAMTTEASRMLPSRSGGRGRCTNARGTTKGMVVAASNAAARKISASPASETAASRDIGRRRSTRGKATCVKEEPSKGSFDENAKRTIPPREDRRRRSR